MAVSLQAAIQQGRNGVRALGEFADRAGVFGARAWDGEEARLVLWWPVALGAGIAVYFGLGFEPRWMLGATMLAAALVLAIAGRLGNEFIRVVTLALLAVAIGFATATVRSALVDAPAIERRTSPITLIGSVERVDPRGEHRIAITLKPEAVGRLEPDQLPRRIRVTVSRKSAINVLAGANVRLRAVLMPPPEPVAPGAFDFARNAWFTGLGGVGFAVSRVEVLPGEPIGAVAKASARLERLRNRVAARVIDVAPGAAGAVAAALLTGKRGAIPEDVLQTMRDAGLAHLLAISGLHMALVCGTVFFAIRLCLALVPWLALRIEAKKWAAGAALLAGLGYYLLAGGSVATERAFVMAAISLIAVMLDRPVITMRNVAIAATMTLLSRPESLLQPGFQMSFGAVIALVAFYDAVRSVLQQRRGDGYRGPRGPIRAATVAVLAVSATTVVATFATGPIAAFHFNRAALYGLAANLVAVPLTGTFVMPLGVAALVAMPFGLETVPLTIMAALTGYVIDMASLVAAWPGAVRLIPTPPPQFLGLFAIGGLWLCLWRRRWRWFGLAPIVAALMIGSAVRGPDLIVAREGENMALRADNGQLAVALARRAKYSVETWLRRDGDGRKPGEAVGPPFVCDLEACTARMASGDAVAYVLERSALAEECWRADILIARVPVTIRCRHPRLVIDLFDLLAHGAHAVRFATDGSIELFTSAGERGDRPWVSRYRRSTRED